MNKWMMKNVREKKLSATFQVEFDLSNKKISNLEHPISITCNVWFSSPFEFLAENTHNRTHMYFYLHAYINPLPVYRQNVQQRFTSKELWEQQFVRSILKSGLLITGGTFACIVWCMSDLMSHNSNYELWWCAHPMMMMTPEQNKWNKYFARLIKFLCLMWFCSKANYDVWWQPTLRWAKRIYWSHSDAWCRGGAVVTWKSVFLLLIIKIFHDVKLEVDNRIILS